MTQTEMNISTLNPKKAIEWLGGILQLPDNKRMTAGIWGRAGEGKSDTVFQTAKKLKFDKVADIRVAVYDPSDLKGIPVVDQEKKFVKWLRDGQLLPTDPNAKWLIFLDEITSGSPLVMAMCYQLCLDGKLADYVLPSKCRIVWASNRKSDRGVVNQMPAPLRNRSVHINFENTINDWAEWMIKGGKRQDIIAFNRWKINTLHDFDNDHTAFPTPRAWSMLSDLLDTAPTKDIETAYINGTVGKGVGSEFNGFQRVYKTLPDLDNIISNPTTADIPTETSTLFALTGSLARRADDSNFDNIVTYAQRLKKEFTVLLCMDAIKLKPELEKTKAWVKVAVDIQEVIF
jgi:hypothetical protein